MVLMTMTSSVLHPNKLFLEEKKREPLNLSDIFQKKKKIKELVWQGDENHLELFRSLKLVTVNWGNFCLCLKPKREEITMSCLLLSLLQTNYFITALKITFFFRRISLHFVRCEFTSLES